MSRRKDRRRGVAGLVLRTEVLPPEVRREVEAARERGFSELGQAALAQVIAASPEERATVAGRICDAAVELTRRAMASEQGAFELLVLVNNYRLYESRGHASMRDFIRQEIGPVVQMQRSTMFLLAGAIEERESIEREFGMARAPWTVLARLAPETRRQGNGQGYLSRDDYGALRLRAARGEVSKRDVMAILAGRKAGAASDCELSRDNSPTTDGDGSLSQEAVEESDAVPEVGRATTKSTECRRGVDPGPTREPAASASGDVASRALDELRLLEGEIGRRPVRSMRLLVLQGGAAMDLGGRVQELRERLASILDVARGMEALALDAWDAVEAREAWGLYEILSTAEPRLAALRAVVLAAVERQEEAAG